MNEKIELPMNMVISGATMCGKSHLFKKILKEQLIPQINYLLIFSPTINVSKDYDEFQEQTNPKKGLVIQKFNKDFINIATEVIDSQTKIIESVDESEKKKVAPVILLLFDDIANNKIVQFKGLLDNFSMISRHLNVSMVFIIQRLTAVGRSIRLNCKYLVLFSCTNFSELQRFLEEYCLKRHKKTFEGQIEEIFNEKYNFILIKNFEPRIGLRMFLNGKDQINIC